MATVVSRTVTINAAFLQEIKEENVTLHSLLDEVQRVSHRHLQRQAQAARFAQALGELRDQLAMHFALEEAFGYFEDAVSQAPRLSQRAEHLRAEHGELFVMVCTLAELAEQFSYDGVPSSKWIESVVQNFRQFMDRFHAHEHGEKELILSAFDDDIGGGD